MREQLGQDAARRRQEESRAAALRDRRPARPRSRPTARPAMAAARRASSAIPTSTTTTGSGAARSTRSRRPSCTASAPTTRTRATRRCRASASTSCSTTRRSAMSPSMCCRSRAASDRCGCRRARRRRSSRSSAPRCHGDDGKGKLEQGAPNLTDGIWLYGGSTTGDRREHPHRPRRRDAGVGRPPRSGHHQVAGRLRAQPGWRQVGRRRFGRIGDAAPCAAADARWPLHRDRPRATRPASRSTGVGATETSVAAAACRRSRRTATAAGSALAASAAIRLPRCWPCCGQRPAIRAKEH